MNAQVTTLRELQSQTREELYALLPSRQGMIPQGDDIRAATIWRGV